MDKSRADVLLAGLLNAALATLVLYEFWQFYSVGSVDAFGKMNGWRKFTYSENPNGVFIVLGIYTGMLGYGTIGFVRAQLAGCASGNFHVPSRISGRGRNRRTV
jgi:hypothetical protein